MQHTSLNAARRSGILRQARDSRRERYVEEDSGWKRDRRVWVTKSDSHAWACNDLNEGYNDGYMGDNGWIHHLEKLIVDNGKVWFRTEFHAGYNSNGLNSCEKCQNVLIED